jgi:hypothetical protein
MRTVRAYSGMLYRFFGTLGKPPDQVTATEIFGYAHGTRSGDSNLDSSRRVECPGEKRNAHKSHPVRVRTHQKPVAWKLTAGSQEQQKAVRFNNHLP